MKWHNILRGPAFLLLIFQLSSVFADCDVRGVKHDAPILCGHAIQGGFLYGESDWQVGGQGIVQKDGVFAIGIPMDAPEKLTLEFCKDKKCKSFEYKIKQRKYAMQHVKVGDKFVHYPPEIQKRIDSENEKIMNARAAADSSFIGFMDLKYPFSKKYPISGVYGSRRVFNGEQKSPHKGLDIAAPKGTSVRAIGAGRVVLAIDAYLSGKTIFIDHGYGIYSAYVHLDKIRAKPGDIVNGDSVIGTVGSTGRASGPHLHLGLYHNQTPLDAGLLFK